MFTTTEKWVHPDDVAFLAEMQARDDSIEGRFDLPLPDANTPVAGEINLSVYTLALDIAQASGVDNKDRERALRALEKVQKFAFRSLTKENFDV